MVSRPERKGPERGPVGVPGTHRHPTFSRDLGCRNSDKLGGAFLGFLGSVVAREDTWPYVGFWNKGC